MGTMKYIMFFYTKRHRGGLRECQYGPFPLLQVQPIPADRVESHELSKLIFPSSIDS